ncbi:hypothetical protein LDENG_00239930 [Lucifuga dentata]|nr:hypothetical protein LDENG_00239930 [Lucifuga dentata]
MELPQLFGVNRWEACFDLGSCFIRVTVLNYKDTFSIILLAIVDAQYQFRVVDVGAFGRNSDGGTVTVSTFGKALQGGRMDLPEDLPLPNAEHLGLIPCFCWQTPFHCSETCYSLFLDTNSFDSNGSTTIGSREQGLWNLHLGSWC